MLVAIVDVETTGLDSWDHVIEVGLVMFHIETQTVLQHLSTLLPTKLENPAAHINRISSEALIATQRRLDSEATRFYKMMVYLMNKSDLIVSHNAAFDRKFLNELGEKITTPWLCTQTDFKMKYDNSKSLLALANDFEVPIVNNHRALSDCLLLASIFQKHSSEELISLFEYAQQESCVVVAKCDRSQNNIAKQNGFKFNRWVPMKWSKKVKTNEVIPLGFQLPFELIIADL